MGPVLLVVAADLGDGAAFEQEVAQLMENSMTMMMQYLCSSYCLLVYLRGFNYILW
jgi:hypothetical protein